ncbi:MAG: hypothetical protein J3Q66DRAFT_423572 [Benniella sp.]|nr:MAG: hypothetical protein J3Q66DRAFT_423572 [Benniella sp.]
MVQCIRQWTWRLRDVVSSTCICHDVKQLHLFLESHVYALTERTLEIANQKSKEVYAQIGRLDKLEELGLGYILAGSAMMDLTLEEGWLAELAGLKKLRHFHLLTDLWTSMGQAEVEFMVSNWPKLEKKKTLDMNEHRLDSTPTYSANSIGDG